MSDNSATMILSHFDEATGVTTLTGNGPNAMRAAKDFILSLSPRPSIDQSMIEFTAKRMAEIRASQEGREGIRAFLEKRYPHWSRVS